MFLYTVIPLTKIPRPAPQMPLYFSADKFEVGQIVRVPLARRKVAAIIYTCEDAPSKRQDIRRSNYALRNISEALVSHPTFTKKFLNMARSLADYYYEPLGLMLRRMLPPEFSKPQRPLLALLEKLPSPNEPEEKKETSEKTLVIMARDRLTEYKKIIKKTGRYFLYIAPEYPYLHAAHKAFGADVLRKNISVKSWRELWGKAYKSEIFGILGTRAALFTPLSTNTLIIDGENNTSHKSWDQHPKFDTRYAASHVADINGAHLYMGDTLPSITTFYTAKMQHWRIIEKKKKLAPLEIADMRKELAAGNRSVLSAPLQEILRCATKKDRIFLFINRRGLSSALVCRDCGYVETCPHCEASFVLHAERLLICHHCGKRVAAPRVCKSCGGHRIKFLGGGTERVMEEVNKIAPYLKSARLDSDMNVNAESVLSNFKRGKFNVLVGTRLALKEPLLPLLDYSAMIMADTTLNLPAFNSSEQVYEILFRFRALTKKKVWVQTYHADLSLFSRAGETDFKNFFRDELVKRKLLNYPPFAQLIKLTYAHKNDKIAEQEAQITKQKLEIQLKALQNNSDYKLSTVNYQIILGPAPAFIPKVANKYIWYMLIKWPKNEKGEVQDIKLRNRLLSVVGKDWDIDVDPVDVV